VALCLSDDADIDSTPENNKHNSFVILFFNFSILSVKCDYILVFNVFSVYHTNFPIKTGFYSIHYPL